MKVHRKISGLGRRKKKQNKRTHKRLLDTQSRIQKQHLQLFSKLLPDLNTFWAKSCSQVAWQIQSTCTKKDRNLDQIGKTVDFVFSTENYRTLGKNTHSPNTICITTLITCMVILKESVIRSLMETTYQYDEFSI